VEADPEQVGELQRQLAEEPSNALTLRCELLGPEVGETCWYRFNDARQNGTTELETLQAHFPNLRLQSQEPRRMLPLDAVLVAWEGRGRNSGDGPLDSSGALVAFGVETLPLLQGGGSWLDRFSQLVVPPPLLEAEGDLEAWQALLRRHCLKPSADNPQPKGGDAWILLEQDRERLLEKRLQQALHRISTVELEREGLTKERDGLTTKQQELTAQRDGLANERDELRAERDCLQAESDSLAIQLQELNTKNEGLQQERDRLQAERETLSAQHHELSVAQDARLAALREVFPYATYREQRPDLSSWSDEELVDHFVAYGIHEGVNLKFSGVESELQRLRASLAADAARAELLNEKTRHTSEQLDLLKDLVARLMVTP